MTESNVNEYGEKNRKIILIPTYLAAVACLITGLLVPLFRTDAEFFSDRMMVKYIPQMINTLLSFTGKKLIPDSNFFIPSAKFEETFSISIIATFCSVTVLLYTVLCLISIIMIFPVCFSDSRKRTGFRCAVAVEIITLIIVAAHVAFNCYWMVSFGISQGTGTLLTDVNMIIPLFGALFAAAFQATAKNGYIGVSKAIGIILFFLTAITLFSFSLFIPGADGALSKLSAFLGAGDKAGFITGIDAFTTGFGIDGISIMFGLNGASVSDISQSLQVVIYILTVILTVLVAADGIMDIADVGVGRKIKRINDKTVICKNSMTNNIAIGRYGLTFAVAVLLFIFCFATEGVMPGVYLYFLLILLVLQLVNAIIRTAADNKRFKTAKANGLIDDDGVVIENKVDEIEEEIADLDTPSDEPLVLLEPGFEDDEPDESASDEQAEPQEYVQQEMQLPDSVFDTDITPEAEETSPYVQGNIFDLDDQTDDESEQPKESQSDEQSDGGQPETQSDTQTAEIAEVPDSDGEDISAEDTVEPENVPLDELKSDDAPADETPAEEETTESDDIQPEFADTPPAAIDGYPNELDCDTFINSLSGDEKSEFIDVFIDKKFGGVAGVPDYKAGRDNSEFFAAVFSRITKYRKICSDRLLLKIYKQLNR